MSQTDMERLVFSMEADVRKLMKGMDQAEDKVVKVVGSMKKELANAEKAVSNMFGKTNVGEAVEKTFKRARFGVLEEGGAKIGVFGSALEALGPAGLVAAGGLAAVGLALEMGKKAGEYAEDIEKVAAKLGVTTTALQEYDFVALKSGVSTETFREAILKGSEAFGAFVSNVGGQRSKQAFQALGITPEQARKLTDFQTALPVIADRIKAVGNSAEQAQIAKRLGLEDMLPVLRQGGGAITAMMQQAKSLGLVLDEGLIKRGAQAAERLKIASDVVEHNLTRSFIALAPIVAGVTDKVAKLAEFIADAAEGLQSLDHQSSGYLQREIKREQSGVDIDGALAEYFGARKGADGKYSDGNGLLKMSSNLNERIDRIHAMKIQGVKIGLEDQTSEMNLKGPEPKELVPEKEKKEKKVKKAKAAPIDQTADFDKSTGDERDNATKELAAAKAALTKNIQLHADFEKKAVDAETDKKLKDLAEEEIKVRKSKNDAHRSQQLSALAAARTDTQAAGLAKKELIDREAAQAGAEAYEQHQAAMNATMSDIRSILASMANTVARRNAIEKENLRQSQQRELEAFDKVTKQMQIDGSFTDANGEQTKGLRQSERNVIIDRQGLQTSQQTYQQAGPVDQYVRAMNASVDQAGQKIAVASLEQMNTALQAGLTNWRNFGSAAKSAIQSILGDMLKLSLEKAELALAPGVGSLFSSASSGIGGALSSLWGGAHAAGGTLPAGKVGLVGEKGPELSIGGASGSQIIPADLTRNVLAGISSRPTSANQATTQNLTIHEHYNLTGAVSEGAVKTWIAQGRADTLQQAARGFRENLGSEFASFNALRG